jgi:hypothetical protein
MYEMIIFIDAILTSKSVSANGLHEMKTSLAKENLARQLSGEGFNSECSLLRLVSNHMSRTASFDEQRPTGNLSVESRVVAFNPAKGDPYGAATMPLYQTATFAQPSATDFGAYDYTRSGNPTRDAAQEILAEIDGGCAAFCFSTGMAAISAVTRFVHAGQEVILSDDSYGGTYRLLAQVANTMGITTCFVDLSGPSGPVNLRAAMKAASPYVGLYMRVVPCRDPTPRPLAGKASKNRGKQREM